MTDPYLDLVWAAHVGSTATLVARHLGHALAAVATEIDLGELGAVVGRGDDRTTGRRHVVRAFERLSAARIVSWSPRRATITLSGYIAPASAELLVRLPANVAAVHERLLATWSPSAPPTARPPTVGVARWSVLDGRSVPFGGRGHGAGGLGR